jgi:IclR family acetate operon transcriptional repressor
MNATILPGPGASTRAQPARNGERHSIQSVDRALFLLETIAEAGGEATLTELANRTGLNISTCHHLLATLIQRGFATKVPGRRLYALGARIIYLGHACLQVDLPRRTQSASTPARSASSRHHTRPRSARRSWPGCRKMKSSASSPAV